MRDETLKSIASFSCNMKPGSGNMNYYRVFNKYGTVEGEIEARSASDAKMIIDRRFPYANTFRKISG